jgi:phosphoribosylamine--glycine ligase
MAEHGTNLPIADSDQDAIVAACREHKIDLVVVGNEDPLAAGLVDRLAVEGVAAFGPSRAAAEIEWSKVFAKEFMTRHGIPTGGFAVFDDVDHAGQYVREQRQSPVIKADGLARGKGVIVPANVEEALDALTAIMERRIFADAGKRVLVEDRMRGPEVSAHAFTDGRTVAHMPFSCDHKPVFDGNRGPNTGGMGAYSPAGWLSDAMAAAICSGITETAVHALADEGRPYKGVLFPGIMVTDRGPVVIEFNSRFGDPEAEVLLPRLDSDLLDVLWAVATNTLHEIDVRWSNDAAVGVVLASGGYPGKYETGLPIEGLRHLDEGVLVFHAGTARNHKGALVTGGGRVLTVVASGPSMEEARAKVYRNVERIHFDDMHYRHDIGLSPAASPVQ